MKTLLETADEIPVTCIVAIAYVTMALLTDPFDPTFAQMRDHGALIPILATGSGCWRLLASAFLHFGILHLGMNMLALLSFGPALERAVGSARFAALYLISALGGSIACSLWYDPISYTAGGSGALFGLVGGTLAWQMRAGRSPLAVADFDGPRRLLGWIVAMFVFGLLSPIAISNTGHFGGLVTGFAATFLLLAPTRTAAGPLFKSWRIAFCALLLSTTAWCIWPFTRWDWLCAEAARSRDPQTTARLLDAASLSRYGSIGSPSRRARILADWRTERESLESAQ